MRKVIAPLLAPVISMAILTLGNGFFTTLSTVALQQNGIDNWFIGIISAMYFLGMAIGSILCNRLVVRVGHIRSFSNYAAIMAVVTLLQGVWFNPYAWMLFRFITGFCLAGLFIVIEGWVLQAAESEKKGVIFGGYLIIYYGSQALSQLFLKIHFSQALYDFILIALLITIAIVPVTVTKSTAPTPHMPKFSSPRLLWRRAPIAIVGAVASGIFLGAIYSIYPLFLAEAHHGRGEIAIVMLSTIMGGALLQYPVGWLSDRIDRRLVLTLVCGLTVVLSAILMIFDTVTAVLIPVSFLLGGATFTVYPLCINNASDNLPRKMSVSIIAIMTALYGMGTFLGPILGSAFMDILGHEGFFVVLAVIGLLTAVYAFWRILKKDTRQRKHFVGTMRGKPVDMEELVEDESDQL